MAWHKEEKAIGETFDYFFDTQHWVIFIRFNLFRPNKNQFFNKYFIYVVPYMLTFSAVVAYKVLRR